MDELITCTNCKYFADPCTTCTDGSEFEPLKDISKSACPAALKNPFDTQVGGSHYKKEGVMDVTEWCMSHNLDIGEFNVIKYVFRHEKKNGIEDLRKAMHYLQMIAYMKYKENL